MTIKKCKLYSLVLHCEYNGKTENYKIGQFLTDELERRIPLTIEDVAKISRLRINEKHIDPPIPCDQFYEITRIA